MKNRLFLLSLSVTFICFLNSCGKANDGVANAQGGKIPTNYIILNNGSFSPSAITAVNGNSFTFINHSGAAAGIYSSDSITINKQNIADNTSYYFKKDTAISAPYTIIFRQAGKPNVTGSITLTP